MVDKRTRFLTIRDVSDELFEAGIDVDLDGVGSAFWKRWRFRIGPDRNCPRGGYWVWRVQKKSKQEWVQGAWAPGSGLRNLGDCVKDIYRYVAEAEAKKGA
jgi:hypothetical protein